MRPESSWGGKLQGGLWGLTQAGSGNVYVGILIPHCPKHGPIFVYVHFPSYWRGVTTEEPTGWLRVDFIGWNGPLDISQENLVPAKCKLHCWMCGMHVIFLSQKHLGSITPVFSSLFSGIRLHPNYSSISCKLCALIPSSVMQEIHPFRHWKKYLLKQQK